MRARLIGVSVACSGVVVWPQYISMCQTQMVYLSPLSTIAKCCSFPLSLRLSVP